jgi:colicin import membrane protein
MGLLLSEHSNQRPVLIAEVKNEPGHMQPQAVMPSEQQPIQAVSMDSQEVMQTVNRLKDERQQQQRAEESRQHALTMQAERVKKLRIEEARRLQQLKREAAELAILQKKQRIEEQEHLKKLAQEKLAQEKRIAEMKQQQLNMQKQQQKEAQKLAEMTRKKKDELAQASAELAKKKADEQAHINQANAAKAKADLLQKQQVAAENAANTARIAGEVDKYKALIINAISQQWILPQNADSTLSSQFRIRLAPNGAVLEVSLTRSSGDSILDRSAQSAIYKASPLPVPHDATAFNVFRDITLTVRPVNARG